MKRINAGALAILLTGMILVSRCHHPTPTAALVEIAPGAVTEADQTVMKELVAAFDRAETAVQQADLDALMLFYAKGYNYHGLKQADVRRVWDEVFSHYRQIMSKHVFTELKLVKTGLVTKALVTCTGGLYGIDKSTGKPLAIDSWVSEVHSLVKEKDGWKFLGNVSGDAPAAPPASAPHHPLF
ncbi:MAG TPA: hypothetical protein VLG72_00775 [Nitrospirota bacterium]|nr:hypothetical protein [Nitrospirota bacterium]